MSPQGRKRAALMISRDQPATISSSYQTYRKVSVRERLVLIIIWASIAKNFLNQAFIKKTVTVSELRWKLVTIE